MHMNQSGFFYVFHRILAIGGDGVKHPIVSLRPRDEDGTEASWL